MNLTIRFTFGNDKWDTNVYSLDVPRSNAASISLYDDTVWWITGGFNNNMMRYDTTEMLLIEDGKIIGKAVDPPKLPYQVSAHCIARIDKHRVFIAGGMASGVGHVIMFDERTRAITELPNLYCPRYYAACSSSTIENNTMLMVIGGHCNYDANGSRQVEILNMTAIDSGLKSEWKTDYSMLSGIGSFSRGAHVSYNDDRGTVLLGSEVYYDENLDLSDRVVKLNSTDGSFQMSPQNLKVKRDGPTAVLIPDDHISCE